MSVVTDLLDRCRVVTGSDSETARRIGATRQSIDLSRKRSRISDDALAHLADIASVSPTDALIRYHAETATGRAADAWRSLAASLPKPAPVVTSGDCVPNLYYVKSDTQKLVNVHFQSPEKLLQMRVLQWCLCVARIPPDSPRLSYYVVNWDVPGKIDRALAAGTFDASVAGCPPIDHRHLPAAAAAIAAHAARHTPRADNLPTAPTDRLIDFDNHLAA
jgi:hypothetical protein